MERLNKHGREPRTGSTNSGLVRTPTNRTKVRRIDEFVISGIVICAIAICSRPALQAGPGPLQLRFLVNAVGRQPTTKKISMDSMEPSMEPSSQSQNDKGFEWNQSMMWNKSNIKIGDAEYFHPFSARSGS